MAHSVDLFLSDNDHNNQCSQTPW